jgi:hypothetical protein
MKAVGELVPRPPRPKRCVVFGGRFAGRGMYITSWYRHDGAPARPRPERQPCAWFTALLNLSGRRAAGTVRRRTD